MNKKNFTTAERLRKAIITLHKEEPNAVLKINYRAALALDKIAQQERQITVVLEKGERGKQKKSKVVQVAYDGEIHNFGNGKKKFFFILE